MFHFIFMNSIIHLGKIIILLYYWSVPSMYYHNTDKPQMKSDGDDTQSSDNNILSSLEAGHHPSLELR